MFATGPITTKSYEGRGARPRRAASDIHPLVDDPGEPGFSGAPSPLIAGGGSNSRRARRASRPRCWRVRHPAVHRALSLGRGSADCEDDIRSPAGARPRAPRVSLARRAMRSVRPCSRRRRAPARDPCGAEHSSAHTPQRMGCRDAPRPVPGCRTIGGDTAPSAAPLLRDGRVCRTIRFGSTSAISVRRIVRS